MSQVDARSFNSPDYAKETSNTKISPENMTKEVKDGFEKVTTQPEQLYYDMSGDKYLIIFNHYEYKKTPFFKNKTQLKRDWTCKDVEALTKTFKSFGFKVDCHQDSTYDNIMNIVGEISNNDHTKTSCLAIAILTHGDRSGLLSAYDRPYNLGDITVLLENGHESLLGKPKLFFIQACRGNLSDDGRKMNKDTLDENKVITIPSHSDFLYMYSTVEDYVSWRNEGGSWMIQELCSACNTFAEYLDLLRLLTLTTKNVAYGYSVNNNDESPKQKQTPETVFTLTKFIQFSPSK